MYVVTFYSFKGGVGRSMALVNVAAELVKRGKRVLIVDFDLEAPGLDTFDITRGEHGKGLFDFVCDYKESGQVPDLHKYIYRAQNSFADGELWVMPACVQDETYHNRFRSLDWADLYENQDGFLLFEDLRAQWKESLKADYVLLDSRTGHTDIGGICTRQLPDVVLAFFFPNEQNRRGLQSVVEEIRNEINGPLKKQIDLHFVMSNVPDLDDEDEIIDKEIRKFQETLGFESPSAVIHHYDSLALLEQVTFVVERPRSRLAKEYAELTSAIVLGNLEDREGALAFLELAASRTRRGGGLANLENQLQDIRINHSRDADVLGRLAEIRSRQRKSDEALAILSEAIAVDDSGVDLLLRRARLRVNLGQKEGAVADLKRALARAEATSFDLSIALRLFRDIQPDLVPLISRSPALEHVEVDTDFIRELQASPETLSTAVRLITRWLRGRVGASRFSELKTELVLCLIGTGAYKEALRVFGDACNHPELLDIQDCFNCAMAIWGIEGAIPNKFLDRVIEHSHTATNRESGPNYQQCMSLVYRLKGERQLAEQFLERAREAIRVRGAATFSCWSYLMVSVERFTSDLEEMSTAFQADMVVPEFIRRNSSAADADLIAGAPEPR